MRKQNRPCCQRSPGHRQVWQVQLLVGGVLPAVFRRRHLRRQGPHRGRNDTTAGKVLLQRRHQEESRFVFMLSLNAIEFLR